MSSCAGAMTEQQALVPHKIRKTTRLRKEVAIASAPVHCRRDTIQPIANKLATCNKNRHHSNPSKKARGAASGTGLLSLGPHRSATIMSSTGKVPISAENPECGPLVRKISADTGNTSDKEKPLHQGKMDRPGAEHSPVTGGFLVRMGIYACVARLFLFADSEGCAF